MDDPEDARIIKLSLNGMIEGFTDETWDIIYNCLMDEYGPTMSLWVYELEAMEYYSDKLKKQDAERIRAYERYKVYAELNIDPVKKTTKTYRELYD